LQALACCIGKLELPRLHSQAGETEKVFKNFHSVVNILRSVSVYDTTYCVSNFKKRILSQPRTQHGFEGKRLQAQGDRIGWLLDDFICLDPDAAFATVQRLASEQHQPFEVTQRTLWRRLRDKGLLVVNQENAKNESRHTVKKSIAGKKHNVIQLVLAALDENEGSQSSQNETENNAAELNGNFRWETIMEAEPQ
jgi:hypothetical protein